MRRRTGRLSLLVWLIWPMVALGDGVSGAGAILVGKAKALEARGLGELAAQSWQQLLLIHPANEEALASLIRFYNEKGKTKESGIYLERLRRINPSHAALRKAMPGLSEAVALARSGRPDEAVAQFRKASGNGVAPTDAAVAFYGALASSPQGYDRAAAGLSGLLDRELFDPSADADDVRLALGKIYTYQAQHRLRGMTLLQNVHGPNQAQAVTAWKQALLWENGSGRSQASLNAFLDRYPNVEMAALKRSKALAPAADLPSGPTPKELEESRLWISLQQGASLLGEGKASDAAKLFQEVLEHWPENLDALEGYSGALTISGKFGEVLPVLRRTLAVDSTRQRTWSNLVEATYQASDAQAALRIVNEIPADVLLRLEAEPKYLVKIGQILNAAGELEHARAKFASALAKDAASSEAWEEYLLSSHRLDKPTEALQVLKTMPAPAREMAEERPSFLRAAAVLEARTGNLGQAGKLLDKAQALETQANGSASFATRLQIAQLSLELTGVENGRKSVGLFLPLTEAAPSDPETWRGLILAYQRSQAFPQASDTLKRMPPSVAAYLAKDANFVTAAAVIYKETGEVDEAYQYLRDGGRRLFGEGKRLPPAMNLQLTWLALDSRLGESDVLPLLASMRDRADFSVADIAQLNRISQTYSLRTADKEKREGHPLRAAELLEEAVRQAPDDAKLRMSLASAYVAASQPSRAVAVFKSSDMTKAQPDEFEAAILTSHAAKDFAAGDEWLRQGLTLYPSETSLLRVAARQVAERSVNAPHLGFGSLLQSRSGKPGFEQLAVKQSTLESSTIVVNGLRTTAVVKAVMASTSSPDGKSPFRFGTLALGETFGVPSARGLSAELQVSGRDFGMRFGSTPQGFLVQNLVASFRLRPGGGRLVLAFDRDSAKDTMLSYAGVRDPKTQRVWGGVMANSTTLSTSRGNEKSGVYMALGFQYLDGRLVQSNRRVDGTVGAYWRVRQTSKGSLGAGLNLFGMHYQNNLRYFTLGHGGYFSPQRFVLLNMPLTWKGSTKRLDYSATGSIGIQSFMERAAPFYPTDRALQSAIGLQYARYSSVGKNYNVEFEAAYQLAPNWFLLAYANTNNARSFSQNTASVSLKYSFRPRPLNTEIPMTSVPDWAGRQPFGLR